MSLSPLVISLLCPKTTLDSYGFTSFKNYVVFDKNIPYEDDVLDLYKNGYTISDNGNVKLHVKDREHYKVL